MLRNHNTWLPCFTRPYKLPHPDSKIHGANMAPTWGRQDPGGPHVGPMSLVFWAYTTSKLGHHRPADALAPNGRSKWTTSYHITSSVHCQWNTLQWWHNELHGVSYHQHLNYLLNRLSRRTSKKSSKLRVIGLCQWNPPVTGGFPHKGPVTRKTGPLHDVNTKQQICDMEASNNGRWFSFGYSTYIVVRHSEAIVKEAMI